MSRASCGLSGACVIGTMRPWTLIDGATPAVMKRSDAFLCTISLRKDVKSTALMGLLPGSGYPAVRSRIPCHRPPMACTGRVHLHSLECFFHLGARQCILARDQAAPHQVLQALVHGLHAELLAGLDG